MYPSDLLQLLENRTERDADLITKAFEVAKNAHGDQKRYSGENYIIHPLVVAMTLAKLGMDTPTIVAGILHDTIEDTSLTAKEIEAQFGKDVAFLVNSVSKLGKIHYRGKADIRKEGSREVMNLRRLFFAMAEDIRVIIIKLADRLHNMQTLEHVPKSKQKRIALETLEIFAPIAERLGMGHLKGQLEDLAFPYVYPREYRWVTKHARANYANRKSYLESIMPIIRQRLIDNAVEPLDIHSRIKHHYSLYKKVIDKNMDVDKVYDLVALRVILPDVSSCYEALGAIHKFYKPVPGLIKDYIAMPRPNGYQSLHTTVFCEQGNIVEIQLRTPQMHQHAENGIAAHWVYTESGKKKDNIAKAKEVEWVFKLRDSLQQNETRLAAGGFIPHSNLSVGFMENIKIEFFKNRIFAFTPKGDVKELPEGSTPIDFAYAVHGGLGDVTAGALINGRIVPLDYKLKNGEVVEIIKANKPKPSLGWLRIVKTSGAKKKIRSFFANKK